MATSSVCRPGHVTLKGGEAPLEKCTEEDRTTRNGMISTAKLEGPFKLLLFATLVTSMLILHVN